MLAEADRDGDGKVTFKAPKPKRLEIPHGRTSSSSCPSPERLTAPPRQGGTPRKRGPRAPSAARPWRWPAPRPSHGSRRIARRGSSTSAGPSARGGGLWPWQARAGDRGAELALRAVQLGQPAACGAAAHPQRAGGARGEPLERGKYGGDGAFWAEIIGLRGSGGAVGRGGRPELRPLEA